MRPVNLIPLEERRGEKAPMRTGPLAYVIVGVLAVALVATVAVVLTANSISDRRAEKSALEAQVAQAQAEANRLKSFADFASVQKLRAQTVTSLARSRFDWERVLRELAIVIPGDVWLTSVDASVSPDAEVSTSSSTSTSTASAATPTDVQAPSLKLSGCAAGHEAVARFLAALRDVDGVTRVSVLKSDRPDPSASGAQGATASDATGQVCSARQFVSSFEVVAAFDAAQLGATAAPTAPAPTTPSTGTTTTTTTTPPAPGSATASASSGSPDQGQVADGSQQLSQQKGSAASQAQRGRNAVNTFIPGTRAAP